MALEDECSEFLTIMRWIALSYPPFLLIVLHDHSTNQDCAFKDSGNVGGSPGAFPSSKRTGRRRDAGLPELYSKLIYSGVCVLEYLLSYSAHCAAAEDGAEI
jgi:hypothetical protein